MAKDIIKNIPLKLDINAKKRLDGDIDIRLYSQDINSGQFEFSLVNEENVTVELDESYSAQVLLRYEDNENDFIIDDMILEGNIMRFVFPHNFITRNGKVTMFVYVTKDNFTSDVAALSFDVFVSEIDKETQKIEVFYVKKIEDIVNELTQFVMDYKETLPEPGEVGSGSNYLHTAYSNSPDGVEDFTLSSEYNSEINIDLDKISRLLLNSDMVVSNPNLQLYVNANIPNPPVGGVFNNAYQDREGLKVDSSIDTPSTAWFGIVASELYKKTGDPRYLNKAIDIGNFFVDYAAVIPSWGNNATIFPNLVFYDEATEAWDLSLNEIQIRTLYHVAWALLEIYDITNDERHSILAGNLLDTATYFQEFVNGQIQQGLLAEYMAGSVYNTIINHEWNLQPVWNTFSNTTGDVFYGAMNAYKRVFGKTDGRTYFNALAEAQRTYDIEEQFDKYINYLENMYVNRDMKQVGGAGLYYAFAWYDYSEEYQDGTGKNMPISVNNAWIEPNIGFGKDRWLVGDLVLWGVIGMAHGGLDEIANEILDNFYQLKSPDSEGRTLFYDRYDINGNPIEDDQSKSTGFTSLFMQAQNILGNHDYDAEALEVIKAYQIESFDSLIDGGFAWDSTYSDSFVENKTLGEIIHTLVNNDTLKLSDDGFNYLGYYSSSDLESLRNPEVYNWILINNPKDKAILNSVHEKVDKKPASWITLLPANGWETDINAPFKIRMNQMNTVQLKGVLDPTTKTTDAFIDRLPSGMWPTQNTKLHIVNDIVITINTQGFIESNANIPISVDGLQYYKD